MRPAWIASVLLAPLVLMLGAAPVLADPLPERSNRVVSYQISVRLNPATHQDRKSVV